MGAKNRESQHGFSLIWVVIMLPVMVGIVGLSIEIGHLVWVGQQMQIGADASALAASQVTKEDAMLGRTEAVNMALANEARREAILLDRNDENLPEGDIVFGRFDREFRAFNPANPAVNAVKVVVRRTDTSLGGPVPTIFAHIFGVNTVEMERMAIAMQGGGTGSGLIALADTGECALTFSGSVTTVVTGEEGTGHSGAIQVNSSDPCAVCVGGNVAIMSQELNIVGDICVTGGSADLPPQINPDSDYLPDPLAFLPDPRWACLDSTDLGFRDMQGGEIDTIDPGYYSGGLAINNGSLTLNPGIYVLDGAGLQVTGSANFTADGVLLFITGTGIIDLRGTGAIFVRPPDPGVHGFACADIYEGVSIFQDRNNQNEATVIGTGDFDMEGSFYFPQAHVAIAGDSVKLGNQFIAWTIEVFGNGEVSVAYDGRNHAPGRNSYLVQ